MAEALLAAKTESEIQAGVISQFAGFKSLRVINNQVLDDDSVVLTTEIDDKSGLQTTKVLMKKVGGDWKLSRYVP